MLYTTVGFKSATAAKGMDCPTETKYLSMGLLNADGLLDVADAAAVYGAEAGEVTFNGEKVTVNPWIDNGDGTVTMAMEVGEKALAEGPTGVVVMAHKEDGTGLGIYCNSVAFVEGKASTCDFTDEKAPGFVNIADLECKLAVVGTKDNVLEVYLYDETTVKAQLCYYYDGKFIGSHEVKDFFMESESGNLLLGDGVITGMNVSEGNDLTVTYPKDETHSYTCDITVNVVGLVVGLTCSSEDLMPDFENGDYVNIDSVVVNGEEKLAKGQSLRWKEGDVYTLSDIVVGVDDEVAVHAVKVNESKGESYDGLIDKITVTREADTNVLYVTGWTKPMPQATIVLDCTKAHVEDSHIPVVIKWSVNGEKQEDVTISAINEGQTYEIGVVDVNAKVTISGATCKNSQVAFFDGGKTSYEIASAVAGDNTVAVQAWDD